MTESQLKEARARCEAATPGPWEFQEREGRDCVWLDVCAGENDNEILSAETQMRYSVMHQDCVADAKKERAQHIANLELAAHARTDLPDALDMLERAARIIQGIGDGKTIAPTGLQNGAGR